MPADEEDPPPTATGPDPRGRSVFLARHGETEWNRVGRWQGATDIPLSDVGRAQARELGDRLRGAGIARVYASHLMRARETAEIVAEVLGLGGTVTVDPRLRERGYGCFEGLTRAECEVRHPEAWQRYLADRRAVPPDAEAQGDIVARVTAAMRAVATTADAAPGVPLLVVSHGGTIRTFLHAALDRLVPPLGNGDVFRLRWDGTAFLEAEPM